MADQPRATFQAEKRRPPLSTAWQAPNLLVALVVATAPPICNATAIAQQHPSHKRSANPDTSRGTPKGLTEDAYMAAGMPETAAPQRRPSLPANTSFRNTALLSTVVAVPPQPTNLQAPPLRARHILADTSRGTPKPLTADATLPARNPPFPVFDRRRPVVDTSAGSSLGLREFVPPSVIPPAPFVVAIRKPWLPADTSRSTPKPLFLDATKPFFVPPTLLAHPKKPVWDTSKGLDLPLVTTIPLPLPPGKSSFIPLVEYRLFYFRAAADNRGTLIPVTPPAALKPVGDPFMALRVQVMPKLVAETRVEVIDISQFLQIGQSAVSAAGAIGVYSGVDPNYASVLGTVSVSGTELSVQLLGGVEGVIYVVTIYVTLSTPTETLPISFFLAIAPNLP